MAIPAAAVLPWKKLPGMAHRGPCMALYAMELSASAGMMTMGRSETLQRKKPAETMTAQGMAWK